jgi:hypothetical protein
VTAHRLERRARRIGLRLVVARDDPHLTPVLEPDLRRAEDVTGGNECEANTVDVARLPVVEQLDRRLLAEPRAQYARALARGEILPAPPSRVIPVRVRDHRAVDGEPGIDVEVGGGTVEAAVGDAEHGGATERTEP